MAYHGKKDIFASNTSFQAQVTRPNIETAVLVHPSRNKFLNLSKTEARSISAEELGLPPLPIIPGSTKAHQSTKKISHKDLEREEQKLKTNFKSQLKNVWKGPCKDSRVDDLRRISVHGLNQFRREAENVLNLAPEDRHCNLDELYVNYETGERE